MKLTLLNDFRKDEHGGILAFYVIMFLLMMVGGGMSIDFMRHEIKREAIQDALDRGVLAAAGNAKSSATDVMTEAQITAAKAAAVATVRSYITLAGFDPDAQGVTIVPDISARTQRVDASSRFSVDTYFLRLSGIGILNGGAKSAASVGAHKIEISLVLDISGSMDTPVGGTSTTRLDLLKTAAKAFSARMMSGNRSDYTSMSVIPFSGQVSISDSLADEYYNFGNPNPWHNYSNCMEFNANDYTTTAFGPAEGREQYQHYFYRGQRDGDPNSTELVAVCPDSNLNILPLANDTAKIDALLNGLTPQGGTNTWTGIKWGAALLDSSTQPIISNLTGKNCSTQIVNGQSVTTCDVDPAFSNRPAPFAPPGGSSNTLKFIIVMADGENFAERVIPASNYNQTGTDSYKSQQNADYFDDNKITGWYNWYDYNNGSWVWNPESDRTSAAEGDTRMQNICNAAKDNRIIIYTIGTDITVGSNAYNQMRDCATTPGQFYSVGSDRLEDAFNSIANSIQKLRLIN